MRNTHHKSVNLDALHTWQEKKVVEMPEDSKCYQLKDGVTMSYTIHDKFWKLSEFRDGHVKEVLHAPALAEVMSLLGIGVGLSNVEAQIEPLESA